MWICGRRKGLIREIWSKRFLPSLPVSSVGLSSSSQGQGSSSFPSSFSSEEEERSLETLCSLETPTLLALKKRLESSKARDDCLPLCLADKIHGKEEELIALIATLKGGQRPPILYNGQRKSSKWDIKAICHKITRSAASICLNPHHWNFILRLDEPFLPEYEESQTSKAGGNLLWEPSFSLTTAGSALPPDGNQGGFPWCKLAYWEESHRVGPQFPVFDSSVDVFSEFLKGSGLSLSSIFTQNKNPSSSTRETRKKIGRGLSLSQESNGLWIHNKSSSSIFVNSPTLDFHPLTGKYIVYKVPPGHSLLAFDYALSFGVLHGRRRIKRDSPREDERSVRVSFAKGWGANYRRPNVTNCPCWLEIMLTVSSSGGGDHHPPIKYGADIPSL